MAAKLQADWDMKAALLPAAEQSGAGATGDWGKAKEAVKQARKDRTWYYWRNSRHSSSDRTKSIKCSSRKQRNGSMLEEENRARVRVLAEGLGCGTGDESNGTMQAVTDAFDKVSIW